MFSHAGLNKSISALKGALVLALFRAFFARGIAAFGALFLVVVLGRLYGAIGVGVYALAQAIILAAATLSRYGMNNTLMRYVGSESRSRNVFIYLSWAFRKSAVFSFFSAVVVYLFRYELGGFFKVDELASVLPGIALAIPPFTACFLLSGFFKGVSKPATACLLENGAVSLYAAVIILSFYYFGFTEPKYIGWAYSMAAWVVFFQGGGQLLFLWKKKVFFENDSAPGSKHEFNEVSRSFLIISMAGFMQTVLSVFIAGWFLSSVELGLFKTAQQVAVSIVFVKVVINAVMPPKFAKFYQQGNVKAMESLAKKGVLFGVFVSLPFLVTCMFFPSLILVFFGSEFHDAELLLRVIATAQFVSVAAGSVDFLLNMSGHEKLMRNISLICNVLGLVSLLVFVPFFGALGASLGLSFIIVFQNIAALYFVWRKLGIWTLPMPNFLKYMGVGAKKF